jgi:PilZ domain
MDMEHRCEDRAPLRAMVDVWQRGRYLGRFDTRDLTRGGLFIEATGRQLAEGQYVRLWLHLGTGHELGGLVRHAERSGVGVMLSEDLPAPEVLVAQAPAHAA